MATKLPGVVDRPVPVSSGGLRVGAGGDPGKRAVDSAAFLLGILRVHPQSSEPDTILVHLGRQRDDLLGALRTVSPGLDVGVASRAMLSELPKLAPDCEQAARDAAGLASTYDAFGDGKVHVPHLFGGVLQAARGAPGREALRRLGGDAIVNARVDDDPLVEDHVENFREAGGAGRALQVPPCAVGGRRHGRSLSKRRSA